jgi:hypothetical protein
MPQDLRNIRKGEGFIWTAGPNNPIPAIFPPYYDDPVLKHRARRNPYIKPFSTGSSSDISRRFERGRDTL